MKANPGSLFLVPTPIGNLEDISLRALRILGEVALVAAEDTRTARKLFSRYELKTPMVSYHDNSPPPRLKQLLERLTRGEDIALISEAGTPGLSDPGYRLVREVLDSGAKVIPLPGASAFLTALVASGLPVDRFIFEGFLPPRSTARDKRLYLLATDPRTLVFYESPRRLRGTLAAVKRIMGERNVVIARELTKKFETFIRGKVADVIGVMEEKEVRGEVVLLVAGAGSTRSGGEMPPSREVEELIRMMGITRMEAIKLVAARRGVAKNEIYREIHHPKISLEGDREQ